jgi:hypothetical protein
LPCLRFCESEVVGSDAHDCAVFLVNGEDVEGEAAAGLGDGSGNAEGSPEERAGIVVERMEVEVIDRVGEDAACCLRE